MLRIIKKNSDDIIEKTISRSEEKETLFTWLALVCFQDEATISRIKTIVRRDLPVFSDRLKHFEEQVKLCRDLVEGKVTSSSKDKQLAKLINKFYPPVPDPLAI